MPQEEGPNKKESIPMSDPIPEYNAEPEPRPDPGPSERSQCPQCGKPLLIWPNLKVIAQLRESDGRLVGESKYDFTEMSAGLRRNYPNPTKGRDRYCHKKMGMN